MCIIICYARIFYIVRKTHESVIKSVGSVKATQTNNAKISAPGSTIGSKSDIIGEKLYNEKKNNHIKKHGRHTETIDDTMARKELFTESTNFDKKRTTDKSQQKLIDKEQHSGVSDASNSHYTDNSYSGRFNRLSIHGDESVSNISSYEENFFNNRNNNENGNGNSSSLGSTGKKETQTDHSRTNSLYNKQRKYLTKLDEDEDLKFIDTSIESDLPPTLSNLRYNNNSNNNPTRKLSAQLSVKINESNNFTINSATIEEKNNCSSAVVNNMHDEDKINEFDSAVEYSSSTNNSSSIEQNQVITNSNYNFTHNNENEFLSSTCILMRKL